jgi:MFS family permease
MSSYAATKPKGRTVFYGWYILAAGFLILVVDGGVRFSFGILVKPLAVEFGWHRGAITLAYTLNMFVFGFGQLVAGRLLDRFGPRVLFSVSAVIASTGLLLTAQASSILELYIYYGFVTAVGISGITIGVVSSTISRWFKRFRGLVGALAITGTSFGHFAIIPALALVMAPYGWRGAWVALGVLVLVVVVPLAAAVMRKEPADLYQLPYETRAGADGTALLRSHEIEIAPRDAFLSSSFLFVGITYFFCGFQDFFFITQFVPLATDAGWSNQHASNIQGLAGLLSIAGLLFFPALTERMGRGKPLSLMFFMRVVCFALLLGSRTEFSISLAALLMGFTFMATAPLAAAIAGDYYGLEHIGLITGAILWIHHTGGAVGAYLGGLAYDMTGSYTGMFLTALLMAFAGMLSSLGIRPPDAPG